MQGTCCGGSQDKLAWVQWRTCMVIPIRLLSCQTVAMQCHAMQCNSVTAMKCNALLHATRNGSRACLIMLQRVCGVYIMHNVAACPLQCTCMCRRWLSAPTTQHPLGPTSSGSLCCRVVGLLPTQGLARAPLTCPALPHAAPHPVPVLSLLPPPGCAHAGADCALGQAPQGLTGCRGL